MISILHEHDDKLSVVFTRFIRWSQFSSKWLIGTPNAQHYDECINLLERRKINDILKQQLKIISFTISKISLEESTFNENLDKFSKYLNNTNKILFDLKVSEDISSVSIQILL